VLKANALEPPCQQNKFKAHCVLHSAPANRENTRRNRHVPEHWSATSATCHIGKTGGDATARHRTLAATIHAEASAYRVLKVSASEPQSGQMGSSSAALSHLCSGSRHWRNLAQCAQARLGRKPRHHPSCKAFGLWDPRGGWPSPHTRGVHICKPPRSPSPVLRAPTCCSVPAGSSSKLTSSSGLICGWLFRHSALASSKS